MVAADKTSWAKCNKFPVVFGGGVVRVIHKTARGLSTLTGTHQVEFQGDSLPAAYRQYVKPDVAATPRAFAEAHLAELLSAGTARPDASAPRGGSPDDAAAYVEAPGEDRYSQAHRAAYRKGYWSGYAGLVSEADNPCGGALRVYWTAGHRDGGAHRRYEARAGRPSPLSRRIVAILKRGGVEWPGGEYNAFIKRCYPGFWQKTNGKWVWVLMPVSLFGRDLSEYPTVGSQFRAKNFLQCEGVLEFEDEYVHVLDERPMCVSFAYAADGRRGRRAKKSGGPRAAAQGRD